MEHMEEGVQHMYHALEQAERLGNETLQNIDETNEILTKLQLEIEKLQMQSE